MLVILALPISATNEENVRGISAEDGGSTKSRQRQLLTAPKLALERSLGRLEAANRAADAPGCGAPTLSGRYAKPASVV